jgi:hypothetical protein
VLYNITLYSYSPTCISLVNKLIITIFIKLITKVINNFTLCWDSQSGQHNTPEHRTTIIRDLLLLLLLQTEM